MEKQRNYYLDFLRGLAAINVIVIHTCFWSGESYVPTIVKSLSLLLDVPFFFFLAGWSRSYSPTFKRTIHSLIDLYGKYVFFITCYFILLIPQCQTGGVNNYLAYLSFVNLEPTKFFVIMGSMWFMPVYFTVVPFCMLVINGINKSGNDTTRLLKQFILICFILFVWNQSGMGYLFLSREMLFYSVFFLLGYLLKETKINSIKLFFFIEVFLISVAIALAKLMGVDISNIQSLKFPPHIIYMILSMLAITIALFFKEKVYPSKSNFFVWVGKNAIWFYFAQGIASTVIYKLVERLLCVWYIKLPICIITNICLTLMVVCIIKWLYSYVQKVCSIILENKKVDSLSCKK